MENLSKTYDPKSFEDRIYKSWDDGGYFKGKVDYNKKPYSIVLPPPNITGQLHMGHALDHTLQDVLIRWKRMQGYSTLWQPGTDHASIATEVKVVEKIKEDEGKTKEEIGREEFLKRAWDWKELYGGRIVSQMKKLGDSCDWSRERFTMDEGCNKAVTEFFVKLYEEGKIYRGNRIINWCPECKTSLSDAEVDHEEKDGNFWHVKYPVKDSSETIEIATTRPETILGDTAVAVNPEDERYKALIGKTLILPIVGREIPVIADDYVDIEFGTGAVKITPAHDPNDFEVGLRHDLPQIIVMNEDGTMNSLAGKYEGMDRYECRKALVKDLDDAGYLVAVKEHNHNVGQCYRCSTVVEPMVSKQWFVKMKDLAKPAIEALETGDLKLVPERFDKTYMHWLENIRDWCISRQLWWGHRIPVFYCDSCNHQWATKEDEPKMCPKCGKEHIHQDPDVLDTWFSSALWAFSPLGWGNNGQMQKTFGENDLKDFYPNSLLITGFDIMFFWVARMMMMGEHFMGQLPFKDIYMHALVRDEHGAKMSKSKGNVIDPLDMVETHSADIIRFTLAYLAIQGRDIKLGEKNLEQFRNFTNKLYNASNFLSLNVDTFPDLKDIEIKTPLGLYMQSKLSHAVDEVRNSLDSYKFNEAASTLYRFVWMEFCDWGIEYSKASKESIVELGSLFKETLKMVSPFMPFISDYLYHKLNGTTLENGDSLMIMNFPKEIKKDENIENMFSIIEEAIISIRRAKTLIDMGNSKIEKAYLKLDVKIDEDVAKPFIEKLAKVENIEFVNSKVENSITDVSNNLEVYIPTSAIDMKPIIEKLEKQQEKAQKEFDKLNGMLSNERFVANAPANVIEENKKALDEVKGKLEKIEAELKSLA